MGIRSVSALESIAARTALVSGALFILLLGGLHVLEPEYDPTWRFISEYALGRFGWLMTLAFLSLALSLAGTGAMSFSQARTMTGYIGMLLLALAVLGLLIAAIFKTDPISTSTEEMTFSGSMHVLGASLDYSPVAFLLLSFSLGRNPAWRSIRKWLFLCAGISLILTIGFIATLPGNGAFGPGVYTGLIGRLLLTSYLGWVTVAALHILKLYQPYR
jgi:hypothetical protein